MTISRIFCFAGTLALATLIGTSASSYAAQPCCKWVGGKYINLKTGKQVKPPKGSVAHQTRDSPKQNQNPPRRRILATASPTGTMATPTRFAATTITRPCRLSLRVVDT
jgi:hypothetical protein